VLRDIGKKPPKFKGVHCNKELIDQSRIRASGSCILKELCLTKLVSSGSACCH